VIFMMKMNYQRLNSFCYIVTTRLVVEFNLNDMGLIDEKGDQSKE
jgi:hypothetical protein